MYSIPANTKHLYNFRTMLAVVQMSCKIYRTVAVRRFIRRVVGVRTCQHCGCDGWEGVQWLLHAYVPGQHTIT